MNGAQQLYPLTEDQGSPSHPLPLICEIPISVCPESAELDIARDKPEEPHSSSSSSETPVRATVSAKGILMSGSSILCETPVSVFESSPRLEDAPKKSTFFVCRVQRPSLLNMEQDWSLEPYGLWGSFGYVFKYETGELYLYQLDKDEELTPLTPTCYLSANDWAVLRLILPFFSESGDSFMEHENQEDTENLFGPPPSKRVRKRCFPTDDEIANGAIIISTTWESRTTTTGRWTLRASRRKNDKPMLPDVFVLEAFNVDVGVFRTMLAVPFDLWVQKVTEVGGRISNLFQESRSWCEMLSVKRKLELPVLPEGSGPTLF